MVSIPASARIWLKRPLGRLYPSVRPLKAKSRGHRIVSVGDACTLALLDAGIMPHLAVFDLKCMRGRLNAEGRSILRARYPRPKVYSNPAGTLSMRLVSDAPGLLSKGGAVLIRGEEDLTALAFIIAQGKKDLVVYGQPGKGIVIVRQDKKLIKRISRLLMRKAGTR